MGVVFLDGDDTNELLVPYVRGLNPTLDPEQIRQVYLQASLGEISARRFWQEVGFPVSEAHPDLEKNYLDNHLRLDPEFPEIAARLAGAYRLALLSNDVAEWSDYLCRKHRLNGFFGAKIISGVVGIRKPEPRIYKKLLATIRATPGDCVFIDDRLPNLRSAAHLGMKTIHFRRGPFDCYGEFYPDASITRFPELPPVIEVLSGANE
ncbi:putative hydrolase of the HAD superfamily [Hydrogenispora ethanolica]|jgi:putative hydrolase of the HAD superfamily|uniref:Putative hydrolase of the HAD superfamily n=1 Tax=Hydrogenispora ethanolica TaxID=1082276 RepID=A0A4R1RB73_HYDET|nr:HAD-IA family hydrolase [Hydrogenispora ethanolica]TCL62986.1 putative hydrolase of the HAD superfamily [Hydrogenispora ethanolica]